MFCVFVSSGITTIDPSWLPVFVRGECHNLTPVTEPDTSNAPRYDETLGTVVHNVSCSFGVLLIILLLRTSPLLLDAADTWFI